MNRYFISFCSLLFIAIICYKAVFNSVPNDVINKVLISHDANEDIKTILEYTKYPSYYPLGERNYVFKNCKFRNCYVTKTKEYFADTKYFDAVLFNSVDIYRFNRSQLPQFRSPKQKYIFISSESAHYYPVCQSFFDNYFNWTFSYKLDSDIVWSYFVIYDKLGLQVGPTVNMTWAKMDGSVSNDSIQIIRRKTIAAAWFVSNCEPKNSRQIVATELAKELKKYDLKLDIYGKCGTKTCNNQYSCYGIMERDYYFYLSFENSFAEDYVTEKLLTAVLNWVVPVVYGAADYNRFLPPGSYINAKELGVHETAKLMSYLIKNPEKYAEMLRFRNYYEYRPSDLCNLCAMLNSDKFKEHSLVHNFREWWNPKSECKLKVQLKKPERKETLVKKYTSTHKPMPNKKTKRRKKTKRKRMIRYHFSKKLRNMSKKIRYHSYKKKKSALKRQHTKRIG